MDNELIVSVIVVSAVAAVAALVFFLWKRLDRLRQKALALYCERRGYRFQVKTHPLGVCIQFQGDGWQVVSERRHHRNEAEAGSSGLLRSTVWNGDGAVAPPFVLGYAPSAGGIGALPEWMRQAMLAKVSEEFGVAIAPGEPYRLLTIGGVPYLLFSMALPDSLTRIQAMESNLISVAKAGHVLIRCDSHGSRIELRDCFIRDAETLEALVGLGRACQSPA